MGKINSQAKGKRAEREVAKLINKYLGTNVRRTPQSGALNFKGDIIDINPDSAAYQFHFEVKDQKKLMIPKWWEQIDDDCPVAKTPVNVFKMNAQFYATMQFTDWLSLLAEIEELKEKINDLQLRNSEDQLDND